MRRRSSRSGIAGALGRPALIAVLGLAFGVGLVAAPLVLAPSPAGASEVLVSQAAAQEIAPDESNDSGEPVAIATSAGELDRSERLRRALDAYATALAESDRDARLAGFARAERGFASLVADGVRTAALFTNLGNAALQAQHPGRAVLAYHRALALEPEATTARQNLAHVRSRMPAWVPRRAAGEGAQRLLFYRQIDPGTRATIAAICFAAMAACVALAVRRSEGAFRGLAIAFGLAWASGIASLAYDARTARDDLAIVIADDVAARSADSTLSPLALPEPLPAGVEVEILEEREGWARVRLGNGRDVWLRASAVERVRG